MTGREADLVAATIAAYDSDAATYADSYTTWAPAADTTNLPALTVAGLGPGSAVLDIGSGSGRDLATFRAGGYRAVGIDASEKLAHHARKAAPVVCADMRTMPFTDHTFDAALAAASLLHLPDPDAASALVEIRRVLRPGGRLVVAVKAGDGTDVDRAGRYFRLYTDTELDAALTAAGFTIVTRQTDADVRRPDLTWLIRAATTPR